ncbi:MAG: class I SAM-dependent methyltransferase [Dehalococcoidia bacterium]|nr:class I SAM-dependent methyltransferase [Dehalococcoidia bacterium]
MDRGLRGATRAPARRDDESFLDFVEGLRQFSTGPVTQAVRARAPQALADFEQTYGRPARDVRDADLAFSGIPLVQSRNRIMRATQEMAWREIIATYEAQRETLLAELDEAERRGPGSVTYDPNFVYPAYYDSVEFHIQPGSYHRHPLAGYIYHYAVTVFAGGRADNDRNHLSLVNAIPLPADGQVRRVLELGCSTGAASIFLKERFPNADVWGIDLSAPMVRYAHKRAVDRNVAVHFAQRAAESTGFPDDHFDIVYARILLHETPADVRRQIVTEARRVLRPNGLFVVVDFRNRPPGLTMPVEDYYELIDTWHNGEPYASDFVYSDVIALLRECGFRRVDPDAGGGSALPMRVAEK